MDHLYKYNSSLTALELTMLLTRLLLRDSRYPQPARSRTLFTTVAPPVAKLENDVGHTPKTSVSKDLLSADCNSETIPRLTFSEKSESLSSAQSSGESSSLDKVNWTGLVMSPPKLDFLPSGAKVVSERTFSVYWQLSPA